MHKPQRFYVCLLPYFHCSTSIASLPHDLKVHLIFSIRRVAYVRVRVGLADWIKVYGTDMNFKK